MEIACISGFLLRRGRLCAATLAALVPCGMMPGCFSIYLGDEPEMTVTQTPDEEGDDTTLSESETPLAPTPTLTPFPTPTPPVDLDKDGYAVSDDCDDTNPQTHPGVAETCDDGLDNDCNTYVDENCLAPDCIASDLLPDLSVFEEYRESRTYSDNVPDELTFVSTLQNLSSDACVVRSTSNCFGLLQLQYFGGQNNGIAFDQYPGACDGNPTHWVINPLGLLTYLWKWDPSSVPDHPSDDEQNYWIEASWVMIPDVLAEKITVKY